MTRTDWVMGALLPAIIEQKVTGQEAFSGWRRIVRRFGELRTHAAGDRMLEVVAARLRGAR